MMKLVLAAVVPALMITIGTQSTFASAPRDNNQIKDCRDIPPARPTGGQTAKRNEALETCYRAQHREVNNYSSPASPR